MGCSNNAINIVEANENDLKEKNLIVSKRLSAPLHLNSKDPEIFSEEEQENFIIVKNIGKNNICHCFLIRSTETNDEYAYKRINISDSNDESVKRIKNDVEILKTLNHPNVILFVNALFSDDQKTLYLFTEYADDGNLQMKLDENKKEKKNFDEVTLLNWLMQVCLALKYIHEKEILHRDIKPSNILLMKNIAKLGNFGVAKVLNSKLRHAKTMVATPQYLAPEIINKEKYSFKADIWSLGVTFYQLMYLTYPFEGKTNEEMQKNIVAGKRKEISSSCSYNSKLVELINKMLSKRPEERPSAEEILGNTIISERMYGYLRENDYDQLVAKKTIKNYEDEIAKINENKMKRKSNINEDKLKKFIKHETIELEKKRDEKVKYDLNRQMTLMEEELIRKSNTLEK
jgi:NIMA (never in mitosis gene a)-related kinase